MLFGRDGGVSGNDAFSFGTHSDNSFELFTAYVSYLAPIGNGLMFQGGKLPTLIGAEVVNTTQNMNITRGLLWGLQPVNLTGLTVGTDIGMGFSATVGVLNDAFDSGSVDNNLDKSVTGQVKWESDMVTASVGANWGTDNGFGPLNTGSSTGILDAIVNVKPTDNIEIWGNYDFLWNHTRQSAGGSEPYIHGFAVAGRIGLTDSTGVAARGEYTGYGPLVEEIATFFRTGEPPVPNAETLEIYAFMEAADQSKRQGGVSVSVAAVMERARAKATEIR